MTYQACRRRCHRQCGHHDPKKSVRLWQLSGSATVRTHFTTSTRSGDLIVHDEPVRQKGTAPIVFGRARLVRTVERLQNSYCTLRRSVGNIIALEYHVSVRVASPLCDESRQ